MTPFALRPLRRVAQLLVLSSAPAFAERMVTQLNSLSLEDSRQHVAPLVQSTALVGLEKCANNKRLFKIRKTRGSTNPARLVKSRSFADARSEGQLPRVSFASSPIAMVERSDVGDYECSDAQVKEFTQQFNIPWLGAMTNFGNGKTCSQNNVIWLYPQENARAFQINKAVCYRLMLWAKVACSVQVRRVSSVSEAGDYLRRLPPNSVRHVVLGGPGSGDRLVWGKTSNMFGVEKEVDGLPVGRMLRFNHSLRTISKLRCYVKENATGFLMDVDEDGDGYVYFNWWLYDRQWVAKEDFEGAEIVASPMSTLLSWLRPVMQQHGSVFVDSCRSAAKKIDPNLAEYIAEHLGKGVSVVGSSVIRTRVEQESIGQNMSEDSAKRVSRLIHRVYTNKEAHCPSFTLNMTPDAEGNCVCPSECKTKSGGPCPIGDGLNSTSKFLPYCAEAWAEDQCECFESENKTEVEDEEEQQKNAGAPARRPLWPLVLAAVAAATRQLSLAAPSA